MGFVCAVMMKNAKFPKFLLVSIIAGAIMVVGYGAYEYILMGGWSYVAATIIPNLIQWAGGVTGAALLYYPLTRIKAAI